MDYYEYECIICGEKTERKNFDFCLDCYYTIQEIIDDEDLRVYNYSKLRKLYKKAYNEAMNSVDEEELMENLCYLFAISQNLEDNPAYEDNKDIQDKFYHRQSKEKFVDNFKNVDYRKKWPNDYQCDDGHYVRSFYELILDNWLYHHNIRHEYEKSIYMPSDPNEIVLTDFYLPDTDIYIEVWGIENNKEYTDREAKKKELYDKNHYKRIDLTKEHLKRLNDILPRKIDKHKNN